MRFDNSFGWFFFFRWHRGEVEIWLQLCSGSRVSGNDRTGQEVRIAVTNKVQNEIFQTQTTQTQTTQIP